MLPLDKETFLKRVATARKVMQSINPTLLSKEPDLMLSAYPEYRFMTPNERTDLFKKTFAAQYSLLFRQTVNFVDAEKMTGLMRNTTKYLKPTASRIRNESNEYSALWSKRQFADELGLPYEFFINSALESHSNVQRKRIPRPNQLLTGKGAGIVLNYIIDKSETFLGLNKNVSYIGAYRDEYYIGLPAQIKHKEDVIRWIKSEHAACFTIANSLLSTQEFLEKFGDYVLENARNTVATNTMYVKSFSVVNRMDLYPGCFFLPLAYNKNNDVCRNCVFSDKCQNTQTQYLEFRTGKNLAVNDYVMRKREKQKVRQRRRRAKISTPSPL